MNNIIINQAQKSSVNSPQSLEIQIPSTDKENKSEVQNPQTEISQNPEIEYRETKYRFIIVITYFLLNFANGEQ